MEQRRRAVVALGMFDGMHLGHRALISRAVELAARQRTAAVVYTFFNHPSEILGGRVRLLSTPAERRSIMKELGVKQVRMEPFTRETACLSPEVFVQAMGDLWRVSGVVCGFNYSFGERGLGTPETLADIGRGAGFFTEVVPPVLYEGLPVSSTRVRTALEHGNVALANALLDRPYLLSGKVVSNRRIGRRIGFPTANLDCAPDRVLPMPGVYASLAEAGGRVYRAVTNVGTNPTVDGRKLTVETHLVGFSGSLYGRKLTVRFLGFLRGETKFPSIDALKAQIALDVAEAMAFPVEPGGKD